MLGSVACGEVVHVRAESPKCAKAGKGGKIHKEKHPSQPTWGEKAVYSGGKGQLPGLGNQNLSGMKSVTPRKGSPWGLS